MNAGLRILALVTLALSLGFAIRAARQTKREEIALAALASRQIALHEKILHMEERMRTATGGLVSFGAANASDTEERETDAVATIESEVLASAAPPLSANSVIANDPQQMAEFAKNFREGLDYRCGGMFKALGLSPEQIEKAKDLIVSEQHSWMDMRAAAEMSGLDREGYEALKQEQITIRMKREVEFLGPLADRFREYYHLTAPVRYLAQRLASTVAYPETPVTSAQVERVIEILTAQSQRTASGPWRGAVEPATINWDAASAELRVVLTPAQIATLGLFVQNEAAQARVTQQINRLTAQFKGQPPK
jgi:hypothetical protein